MKSFKAILLLSLLLSIAAGSYVFAVAVNPNSNSNSSDKNPNKETTLQQENAVDKPPQSRPNPCQAREAQIKNTMDKLVINSQRHITVFTDISIKTQQFYQDKSLSSTNYEKTLEEVTAKQIEAEQGTQKLIDISKTFTCDTDNPKQTIQDFREELKQQIDRTNQYKAAVKNLILEVKVAHGTEKRNEP